MMEKALLALIDLAFEKDRSLLMQNNICTQTESIFPYFYHKWNGFSRSEVKNCFEEYEQPVPLFPPAMMLNETSVVKGISAAADCPIRDGRPAHRQDRQ